MSGVKKQHRGKHFPGVAWVWAWPAMLLYYAIKDMLVSARRDYHILYGVSLYVGEVGSGKTMGMVERALRIKSQDTRILLWSNFPFEGADHIFKDLQELVHVPSYTIVLISEGALFANARDWQGFPVGVVEILTQNRKWGDRQDGRPPGVLLLWDVQDPAMIDANVRRLTNWVIHCRAMWNFGNGPRFMWQWWCRPRRYFNRQDPDRVPKHSAYCYVATDRLRRAYDSYHMLAGRE